MSVFSYVSPARIARFVAAVRQEGWRAAFAKVRAYIAMRRAGHGRSALPVQAGDATAGGYYLGAVWRELADKAAFHATAAPATLRPTRRIAMIGDLNLPQCRKYRVEQLAEFWQRQGVDYGYAHYQDVPRAVDLLQSATHLMFYRAFNEPLTTMYFYEARRLRLPVLYDLDDPLFSISAYETYENMKGLPPAMKAHFLREAPKYLDAINMADIVTMSTPALAEHTRLYTARPVYFRRNFADRATFAAADAVRKPNGGRDRDGGFRVAFASGSQGHEVDFALIADDIAGFLAADPTRRLAILGHFDTQRLPQALRGQIETHRFATYDRYLATLATADCAVMPLTDDIFNRCKSAVRVIDAAAVGVPAVVGRIGDMAQMVQDGVTGRVLPAGAAAGWGAALEELAAENGAAAARMGQAARADLEANWAGQPALPIVEPEVLEWVRG